MMIYDFHKLKIISVANGEVMIRIPERWGVWPHETVEGSWGCYEEGNDHSGTLWIQVDHFDWPDGKTPPVGFADRQFTEMMVDEAIGELPPLLENTITPVDQGHRWFRVYDVEENGEWLRFWFSHFNLGRGNNNSIISFNFVLTHDQMDDPEFIELRDIMEREISAAFLDPFRVVDEQEAVETFGPLRRCNFNDQVTLDLPEAMGCWPQGDGDAENQWYCRLTMGPSHAGMFVFTDDFQFAWEEDEEDTDDAVQEEYDERGLEIFEQVFQEVLSEWTDTPGDGPPARRMPWGAVFYKVTDDEDAGVPPENGADESEEEDRPLRNYHWQIMRHEYFKERRLQVLLMIPIAEADTPPFPQLRAYMDRAVRRARFPGFEKVEDF